MCPIAGVGVQSCGGPVDIFRMNSSPACSERRTIADTTTAEDRGGYPAELASWVWKSPDKAAQDARQLFFRVLERWAMDVLALRASGLSAPSHISV